MHPRPQNSRTVAVAFTKNAWLQDIDGALTLLVLIQYVQIRGTPGVGCAKPFVAGYHCMTLVLVRQLFSKVDLWGHVLLPVPAAGS
jgi:hypothetical protein